MSSRPVKPKDEDCCGSGCNPCILDAYEKAFRLWETRSIQSLPSIFEPTKYVKLLVINIDMVALNTVIFTLQALDDESNPISLPISLKMGDHLILKTSFTDVEGIIKQISRPYTPILNDLLKCGKIQFIIRFYEHGIMSEILEDLKINDFLYCRGPYNELNFNFKKRLILIGAGTGVIPLYNIAKEIVHDEDSETVIHVYACFSSPGDILLRDDFQLLYAFWNFHCQFYFSNKQIVPLRHNERGIFHKLDAETLSDELATFDTADISVIICGPLEFNNNFKDIVNSFSITENNIQIL